MDLLNQHNLVDEVAEVDEVDEVDEVAEVDEVDEGLEDQGYELYQEEYELNRMKTSIDVFLERKKKTDRYILDGLLFLSLCQINIPFAIFYMSLSAYIDCYKLTDYNFYCTFKTTSIIICGYFFLLSLCLYIIDNIGDINLHPNSKERPLFYFR